jgi:hypothetical protein
MTTMAKTSTTTKAKAMAAEPNELMFTPGTIRRLFEQACMNAEVPEAEREAAWEAFREHHMGHIAKRWSREFAGFLQRRLAKPEPVAPGNGEP